MLICPATAIIVFLFYRSFALLGASIAIFVIAVFLIRTSDGVNASYRLLQWLKGQKDAELRKNDVVYAELSLSIISTWRTLLIMVAVVSMVAAPWGNLIPDAIAFMTSSFLITVFSLVYPPIAIYSHEVAIVTTLYIIPLGIALLWLIYQSISGLSLHINKPATKLGNL
jgi:hypothetical protein